MTDDAGLLYLEDLSVGQRFASREQVVETDQIVAFGREFDPQPFHVSERTAQGTFFDGLAASGWHTASLTMRLLVESIPLAHGIVGAGGEIAWPRPVRPGDRLRVIATITEIQPSASRPGRAKILVRSETVNQEGEVKQTLTATLLAFSRALDRAGG